VNKYACNCYKRLGITAAQVESVVWNGMATIDCKQPGKGTMRQLYTTQGGDDKIRDIEIPVGKCKENVNKLCSKNEDCDANERPCQAPGCKGDLTKACLSDADCGAQSVAGPCLVGRCVGDATKACLSDEDCAAAGPCKITYGQNSNRWRFNNNMPVATEVTEFPPECDRPAWLPKDDGGSRCYGNSYIHKWDIKTTIAPGTEGRETTTTVALLCRHSAVWTNDDDKYDNIAMIMHNDDNGQTCWFQSQFNRGGVLDGTKQPPPHTPAARLPDRPALGAPGWWDPSKSQASGDNCIECHDNGPWMNSRWMFHSRIDLRDEREPYINEGVGFKDWRKPKFVTVGAVDLKGKGASTSRSCTSCHRIDSTKQLPEPRGGTPETWAWWTVGKHPPPVGRPAVAQPRYPPGSNEDPGQKFKIAYWMPCRSRTLPGALTVDADEPPPDDWKKYDQHMTALLKCCEKKGKKAKDENGNIVKADPCDQVPPKAAPAPPATVAAVTSCGTSGVNLCADTNDDGKWDHIIPASTAPYEDGYDSYPVPIPSPTHLTVSWSADADHPNCFISTTFPAGVEVDGTTTATNWLLSESPQEIGYLDVPGEYYFHIDCDDRGDDQISATLTFRVYDDDLPGGGQPPTVLQVEGIIDGESTMAFDYPCPDVDPCPELSHADIDVVAGSEVKIGWAAYNVVPGTCTLTETFDPPGGHTPRTFPEVSGFESVTRDAMTNQTYRLTCTGNDGAVHSVAVTLVGGQGACCDHDAFGGCENDRGFDECQCEKCEWFKDADCSEIECPHESIPVVSAWGLVVMTILLLTGAKIYFGRRQAKLA
jgi:hypothetical protein